MKKLLALMLILAMTFALMVSCVDNDGDGGDEGSSENGGNEGGNNEGGGTEGDGTGDGDGGTEDDGTGSGIPSDGYFDEDGWTRP